MDHPPQPLTYHLTHAPITASGRLRHWAPIATMGLLLLAVRLAHFPPYIDEPHAWRQMDTAQYIRAFAEDPRGIDLLHPAVSWMGDHKTLILEFPLPEALAAGAIKIVGARPTDLLVPRLVFFGFFLAALLGFFLLARDLMGPMVAAWACLFYLASPLAQAYSRAIHIDFSVLACVHFACLFLLRGVRTESMGLVLWGTLAATLAALIKGPYLLSCLLMLLPFALEPRRRPFLRLAAVFSTLPVLAFGLWRFYTEGTNAKAPDWGFIPEYHRFTEMGGWYFGSLAQRLRFTAWRSVMAVLSRDVVGAATLPFVIAGVISLIRSRIDNRVSATLSAWILGSAIYILVFFNLNVVHDYYLLPLVAPLSMLAAVGVESLRATLNRNVRLTLAAVVMTLNVVWAEARYYKPVGATATAGEIVGLHTPAKALVITSWPAADPRTPHVLFAAHRYGWSVRSRFLTQDVVNRLRDLGATYLAQLQPETDPSPIPCKAPLCRSFSFKDAEGRSYRLDLMELSGLSLEVSLVTAEFS